MNTSILIVEDNMAHLRGLMDHFADMGYEVHAAGDGESGLKRALELRPDIIVLDIMMPRKNGYEVCADIRSHGMEMPIVMLTAKDNEQDIIQGLELGADDYVTKPFRINELAARVKSLLRRHKTSEVQVLNFDGFTLDLVSHQLKKDEVEVELTRKEFDLLKLFLQKPNCALTRNQIMREVWGSRIVVTPRSVDRCVTTLRSKIEPDSNQPTYIQTIRDIGYRFRLPEVETNF